MASDLLAILLGLLARELVAVVALVVKGHDIAPVLVVEVRRPQGTLKLRVAGDRVVAVAARVAVGSSPQVHRVGLVIERVEGRPLLLKLLGRRLAERLLLL